jgi:integrase/recombinase XerD
VNTSPVWWRQRLNVVRGFAQYLRTIDPDTDVPPRDLLPAHQQRVTPYLYSDTDLAALMAAARSLSSAQHYFGRCQDLDGRFLTGQQ